MIISIYRRLWLLNRLFIIVLLNDYLSLYVYVLFGVLFNFMKYLLNSWLIMLI